MFVIVNLSILRGIKEEKISLLQKKKGKMEKFLGGKAIVHTAIFDSNNIFHMHNTGCSSYDIRFR